MKPLLCFALLASITTFIACKKDEPYDPYPVWLLYARCVVDSSEIGVPFAPVAGCPQAVFHVVPNGRDSTVGCHEHSNVVKIWDHIDSVITIEYYITCPNYYDSDPVQRTFRVEDAIQRPGRDGAEAQIIDTVVLQPQ